MFSYGYDLRGLTKQKSRSVSGNELRPSCAPAADIRHTMEWACLVYSVMLITVKLLTMTSSSLLQETPPASWIPLFLFHGWKKLEKVFYSLIYGLSLITAISEVVCKKECHEHSNCRCLLWSAEIMQGLTAEAETEFQLIKFQFGVLKEMLDFCLWAFQYGRGYAWSHRTL